MKIISPVHQETEIRRKTLQVHKETRTKKKKSLQIPSSVVLIPTEELKAYSRLNGS